MIKFRTLISSVAVGIVLTLSASLPAWAAATNNSVSLTTSPVTADLTGQPGTSVTTNLQVMNNSPIALNINMQLDTFRASGTTGQAQIITPTSGDDFIHWVTFSKNSFVAQPGVWNTVQMTINIPSYGAWLLLRRVIQTEHTNFIKKLTESLKSSNAVLVLLNVHSPNEHPSLKVTSFTSKDKIYEYLPATLSVDVYNNGNIYLPPTGDVLISRTNNFNKTLDVLPINTAQGNVLPGTSRIYTVQWTDGFPVFVPKTLAGQPIVNSKGTAVDQLKWDFSKSHKFRFGKYYAKMVLVYNNGTQDVPITGVVSFWVIPWKLIILFILFLAVIAGLIYLVFHYKHKANKKAQWKA